MAERTVARDLERSPAIRPAASPVDTYARPRQEPVAKPDLSVGGLADLAKSLSEVEPGIQKFLVNQHKEVTEEDERKGAAARLQNQTAFREAVAKGLIPEGASPWFIKGYQKQEGRLDGRAYYEGLSEHLAQSGVANSDDPAVVNQAIEKYRNDFMQGKQGTSANLDWLDGFKPEMDRAEVSLASHHIAERQKQYSLKVRDNTAKEIGLLVSDHIVRSREDEGLAFGGDDARNASLAGLGGVVSQRLAELARTSPMLASDVNKITVDSIIAKAVETKDKSLLSILDSIKTGSGYLGGTSYARDQRLQAETAIERELKNDITWGHTLETWRNQAEDREYLMKEVRPRQQKEWERADASYDKKQKSDAILGQLVTDAINNPTKEPDVAAMKKLAGIDARDATYVANWLHSWRTTAKNIEDDPLVVNRIMQDMALAGDTFDVKRIFNGVPQRQFGVSTMLRLYNEWQQNLANGGANDPVKGDWHFKKSLEGLEGFVKGNEATMTDAKRLDAANAAVDYVNSARAWKRENPNAKPSEWLGELRRLQKELGQKYNTGSGNAGLSTSLKDQDAKEQQAAQQQTQQRIQAIPPGAVQLLKQDPYAHAEAFDQKYGEGAAEMLLTQPQQAPAQQTFQQPTPADIKALQQNPALYRRFNQKYGPGAAAKYGKATPGSGSGRDLNDLPPVIAP